MKVEHQAIRLSQTSSESRLVKSCALFAFRALRTVAEAVAQVPAVATQTAHDVAEAWEEYLAWRLPWA